MPNSDLRVFPRAHAAVSDLPFPVLEEPAADRWRWPMPPFAWHHQRPDDDAVAQACRLETPFGTTVDGEMLGIEPRLGRLAFRTGNGAPDRLNGAYTEADALTVLGAHAVVGRLFRREETQAGAAADLAIISYGA